MLQSDQPTDSKVEGTNNEATTKGQESDSRWMALKNRHTPHKVGVIPESSLGSKAKRHEQAPFALRNVDLDIPKGLDSAHHPQCN